MKPRKIITHVRANAASKKIGSAAIRPQTPAPKEIQKEEPEAKEPVKPTEEKKDSLPSPPKPSIDVSKFGSGRIPIALGLVAPSTPPRRVRLIFCIMSTQI